MSISTVMTILWECPIPNYVIDIITWVGVDNCMLMDILLSEWLVHGLVYFHLECIWQYVLVSFSKEFHISEQGINTHLNLQLQARKQSSKHFTWLCMSVAHRLLIQCSLFLSWLHQHITVLLLFIRTVLTCWWDIYLLRHTHVILLANRHFFVSWT